MGGLSADMPACIGSKPLAAHLTLSESDAGMSSIWVTKDRQHTVQSLT